MTGLVTGKAALPPVRLIEVGPRDGLQSQSTVLSTQRKIDIITCLAAAGLTTIQVTAFVHPGRVPQLADAEALVRGLPSLDGVTYNALVLNKKGLERALQTSIDSVEISVSASDTHSRRNTGRSRDAAVTETLSMIGCAKKRRRHVRAGIQCAFGCVFEGNVPDRRVTEMVRRFVDAGIDALALADTTGMATPEHIRRTLPLVMERLADVPLVLHLHDTRGLGYANLIAATACGITHFDTSLSGIGGCPVIPGAAGNIDTAKTAALLSAMGYETHIDARTLSKCARLLCTAGRCRGES